jgi:hypothetical protein
MSSILYVAAPIVPPAPNVAHPVGENPAPDCVALTGLTLVETWVTHEVISVAETVLVAFCNGKEVPIFEYPSPYPDLDSHTY